MMLNYGGTLRYLRIERLSACGDRSEGSTYRPSVEKETQRALHGIPVEQFRWYGSNFVIRTPGGGETGRVFPWKIKGNHRGITCVSQFLFSWCCKLFSSLSLPLSFSLSLLRKVRHGEFAWKQRHHEDSPLRAG